MIIQLSLEQQNKLLNWEAKINLENSLEECLLPGYELAISILDVVGEYSAEARSEGKTIDLGDVEVIFE